MTPSPLHPAASPLPPLSRRTLIALAALTAGSLAACSSKPPRPSIGGEQLIGSVARTAVPVSRAPDLASAVAACDTLGATALSAQLADGAHSNALVSPASLGLSLAAAALGATDPAAQGINTGLGCADEATRNTTWSAIQNALLAYDGDPSSFDLSAKAPEKPLLHVAYQLLVIAEEGQSTVNQDFIDGVGQWFSADLRRSTPAQARAVLDAWAKLHTGGLIEKSAITRMDPGFVVQNAVLFAARWKTMFEESSTHDQDFTLPDGAVVQVPMMHQSAHMTCTMGSSGASGWKVLRVPYSEGFALDIILPDAGTLPESLPADTWARATALLDEATSEGIEPDVKLALPRIDVTTPGGGFDVLAVLAPLGIDAVPMGRAGEGCVTSEYRQQVRLLIQEDGAKAAALSEQKGLAMAPAPGETTDFIVDHPYAMRLRDLSTGLSLFEAIINDPRG